MGNIAIIEHRNFFGNKRGRGSVQIFDINQLPLNGSPKKRRISMWLYFSGNPSNCR